MVIENEMIIQLDLQLELEDNGFDVFTAERGDDAVDIVKNNEIDCILFDVNNINGDINAVDTIRMIKEIKDIPVVCIISSINLPDPEKHPYVVKKPFKMIEIRTAIGEALKTVV